MTMDSRAGNQAGAKAAEEASIFTLGKQQSAAMLSMQRGLVEAYEQAGRTWLARVQSEAQFWTELASRLSTTRSVPEAIQSYQQSVSERMQMAAEDARRLSDEWAKAVQRITGSLLKSEPKGST
jgi:hypothetical protein